MNKRIFTHIATMVFGASLLLVTGTASADCTLGNLKEIGNWGARPFMSASNLLMKVNITASCKDSTTVTNCHNDNSRICYNSWWDQLFGTGHACGEEICTLVTTSTDVIKGKFSNTTLSFSPFNYDTKKLTGTYKPKTGKIFFLEEGASYSADTNKPVAVDRGFWVKESKGKLTVVVEIYKPGTRELFTKDSKQTHTMTVIN